MSEIIDVLLLLALPASGKSEVRRYLASLSPEQCRGDFHLGPTVQLDDYPYVHMMRRVSQELRKQGADGVFFDSDELPMKEPLRSEEHTSELQSLTNLVCRLLLEKK